MMFIRCEVSNTICNLNSSSCLKVEIPLLERKREREREREREKTKMVERFHFLFIL
jgi:hypothetical protein